MNDLPYHTYIQCLAEDAVRSSADVDIKEGKSFRHLTDENKKVWTAAAAAEQKEEIALIPTYPALLVT